MPATFRLRPPGPLAEKINERELVEETFFHDNAFGEAQQRARIAMWWFHGLLLFGLGLLLGRVFGLAWAAGTLSFLALEPTVGAHLPVVMTDLPLALTLGLAALCAGLMLATWRWGWTVAFGLASGLALSSKHSALAGLAGLASVSVVGAVFQTIRERSIVGAGPRAGKLLLAAALGAAVLWAQYGFHFHAAADGRDAFNRPMAAKIADLTIGRWREGIGLADRWQLLPRPYLWGLSDTVRAGVEGRGASTLLLWGVRYEGRPPWFTWPSYVASKVPLGLLALALIGLLLVWRSAKTPAESWSLLALAGMASAHLLALAASQGAYAGVRHALPVVLLLAVLAGAAVARVWQTRSKALALAVGACLGATAVMTLREPRLWEYHNELAGGTANAWQYFANEGLDLGQRAYEIDRYVHEVIVPSGASWYQAYWILEAESRALDLQDARKVKDINDTNVAGVYEGYFVYPTPERVPRPDIDWNPEQVFKDLHCVARFGVVEIWRGRQVVPNVRAHGVIDRVVDYIYKQGGSDWGLVAKRLEEALTVVPAYYFAAVELGNAYLRLGRRDDALRAYRQPLSQLDRGIIDDITRKHLEQQIAKLERGDDLSTLKPLLNRDLE